jgi:hypothetical protein
MISWTTSRTSHACNPRTGKRGGNICAIPRPFSAGHVAWCPRIRPGWIEAHRAKPSDTDDLARVNPSDAATQEAAIRANQSQ